MSTNNAIIKNDINNLVNANPATMNLEYLLQDSGAGNENITSDDIKTPFIRIIQQLSPQCNKSDPAYIEGCEPGALYNTMTEKFYTSLNIIPVHYEIRYIERKRKDEKQTTEIFVCDHGINKDVIIGLQKENFAYVTDENNLIYPTATEYVLFLDEQGMPSRAILSFPSTLASQSRQLNGMISEMRYPPLNGKTLDIIPPRWYKCFNFSTQIRTRGINSWYIFKIVEREPLIKIGDDGHISSNITSGIDLYHVAKDFSDLIKKGDVELQIDDDGLQNIDDDITNLTTN